MRKLSLLIALCTLLTVGGVYATWTYTNESVPSDQQEYSLNLSGIETTGNYGTFTFSTDNVNFTIDPKEGTTHTTALDITGTITITFTPNAYAPQKIKDYGPNAEFFFSLSNDNWTYVEYEGAEAKKIVNLVKDSDDATHPIYPSNSTEESKWTKNGDVFTYTIETDVLEEHIVLTEFLLDTVSDYYNYKTALSNGQVLVNIQDAAN